MDHIDPIFWLIFINLISSWAREVLKDEKLKMSLKEDKYVKWYKCLGFAIALLPHKTRSNGGLEGNDCDMPFCGF